MTPYEKYVRSNIDAEKQKLDELYNEFARANSVNKQVVKRRIDETLQNIELLEKSLSKYGSGLTWLREPSKGRDYKAAHLEKIQDEKPLASPSTKPAGDAARPSVGTAKPQVGSPVGTRPTVGSPVGAPKPQVGTPVGTRPTVGTPTGTPRPQIVTPVEPQVGTPVGTQPPQVGTSVGASPQVGTPVGSRPQVGTPIGARPQVGTKPAEKKDEKKSEDEQSS